MTDYRDHHATIFVTPEAAGPVEAARQEWDPVMARQIAAHVTLAYLQEAPIVDLLVERLAIAAATTEPFRLRLGAFAYFGAPEKGVCIDAEDIDGGYRKIREELLRPPFHPAAFQPHVTVVHPRTSERGRDFWDNGRYQRQDQTFTTEELGGDHLMQEA